VELDILTEDVESLRTRARWSGGDRGIGRAELRGDAREIGQSAWLSSQGYCTGREQEESMYWNDDFEER